MPSRFTTQSSGANSLGVNLGLLLTSLLIIIQLTLCLSIIVVDMESSRDGTFKIHWRDRSNAFSELKSKTAPVKTGHNFYGFMAWSWQDIDRLKIQPINKATDIKINHVVLRTLGFRHVVFNAREHFESFETPTPFAVFQAQADHLQLTTTDQGSEFEVAITHDEVNSNLLRMVDIFNLRTVLFGTAVLFLLGYFSRAPPIYACLIIIFTAVLYYSKLNIPLAVLEIELNTQIENELTVYWSDKTRVYTEKKVSRIKISPPQSIYRLPIGRLDDINFIRIDPLNAKGQVSIKRIDISQLGYAPIRISADNKFQALDLENDALSIENRRLEFAAHDDDQFFELGLNASAYQTNFDFQALGILLLFLFYLNILYYLIGVTRFKSSINIGRYNFLIGLLIMLMLIIHSVYIEHLGAYLELNTIKIIRFFDNSFIKLSDTSHKQPVEQVSSLNILNAAYLILFVVTLVWISIFYKLRTIVYFVVSIALLATSYIVLDANETVIKIDMQSTDDDELKVYWADEGENYQQTHSVSITTTQSTTSYQLAIENLNNVHNIRIEPISKTGKVQINSIEISENGYQAITLNAENNFFAVDLNKRSKLDNKLTSEKLSIENNVLVFDTKNGEDYFEVIIEPKAFKGAYTAKFYLQPIMLLGGIFIGLFLIERFGQHELIVIIARTGMALLVIMSIQLAWFSEFDMHPDERAHVNSIDYFSENWAFPKIGEARAIDAYQAPWGVSRLDDLGISYFLIGKFKSLLTQVWEDTVYTCRAFNSVLLIILLLLTRAKKFALFCIPLLCFPQLWYLFSYANRDGFSFFLAVLFAWQLVYQHSYLNSYLEYKKILYFDRTLIYPAFLLGLLSIEVSNYAIFILFSCAYLLLQGLLKKTDKKQFFLKCLLVIMIAGTFFGVRKFADIEINGFNKQEQRVAFQEAIADPAFKPSVAVTENGYWSLRAQQKGVSALELFSPKWDWHNLTFKSFTGLYGNEYTESSPEWYYAAVGYLYGLIILILGGFIFLKRDKQILLLSALTLIFVFGDLLMSFIFSWTYDFQPQGRYIFPLIPMLMVYFYKIMPIMGIKTRLALGSCAVLLALLAIYSFRNIALAYMT